MENEELSENSDPTKNMNLFSISASDGIFDCF